MQDLILKDNTIRPLLVDSRKFKSFYSKNNVKAFNKLGLPHYLWIAEIYDKTGLIGESVIDASAHRRDNEKSLIASWNGTNIKFFKQKGETINIGSYPMPYPNLTEVVL